MPTLFDVSLLYTQPNLISLFISIIAHNFKIFLVYSCKLLICPSCKNSFYENKTLDTSFKKIISSMIWTGFFKHYLTYLRLVRLSNKGSWEPWDSIFLVVVFHRHHFGCISVSFYLKFVKVLFLALRVISF